MNILIITIISLLFILTVLAGILVEPIALVIAFKYKPKVFRLHKPKNDNKYYLQVRLFFIYYYIHKCKDDYNITLYPDRFCMSYPNNIIISKQIKIFDDRYEIIKFFSDTSSPEDNINL